MDVKPTENIPAKTGLLEGGTMNKKLYALVLALAAPLFTGCVAIQPLPIAARSGDTITLALGSQEEMNTSNTTATFTPDSTGIPIALIPKAIFNLYADKRSNVYQDQGAANLVAGASHEQWMTMMAVDLPANLPAVFGTIKVSTTAVQADRPNSKVEDVDIRFEVLPGVGQPHGLQYDTYAGAITGNLNKLKRRAGQVYVTPPAIGACPYSPQYAAIELRFRLPFVIEPYRDIELFRLVADDFSTQTAEKPPAVTWSARGDGLTVIFMNVDGTLLCFEPRFSLVPLSGLPFTVAPQLLSVTYYDTNGAVVQGPGVSEYLVTVR